MLEKICAPALLYIAFSITHVIIDTMKGLYNTAMTKFIVMIIFSALLNILCQSGLGIISWIIVFIPFIMMSIITTMVLITFGLSPASGKLKYDKTNGDVAHINNKVDDEPVEYNKDHTHKYETVEGKVKESDTDKNEIHAHTHTGEQNSYTLKQKI